MNFPAAMSVLINGHRRVRRKAWAKGEYVSYGIAIGAPQGDIRWLAKAGDAYWVPSPEDMLADDWVVVPARIDYADARGGGGYVDLTGDQE